MQKTSLIWRTSSYSGPDQQCVEVAPEGGRMKWQISSYSKPDGRCVELAADDGVHIRDSKLRDIGELHFEKRVWRGFVAVLRQAGAA